MSVSLETSLGSIKVKLFYDECPSASENFLAQCAQDNYNGLKAKRSEKGFIIQFPSRAASIHPDSTLETRPTIKHQRVSKTAFICYVHTNAGHDIASQTRRKRVLLGLCSTTRTGRGKNGVRSHNRRPGHS